MSRGDGEAGNRIESTRMADDPVACILYRIPGCNLPGSQTLRSDTPDASVPRQLQYLPSRVGLMRVAVTGAMRCSRLGMLAGKAESIVV